jgi:DNA-binding NarL/FixJ family response regulator
MQKARILLADDHTIVLEGLTRLLEPEFEVVGKAADGRAMLEMAAKLVPEVIIADVFMPLLSGLEALRQLKKRDCKAKVIFLSMHAEMGMVEEALRIGASGYLLKNTAAATLKRAIHEVLNGRCYVNPRISFDLLSTTPMPSMGTRLLVTELTQREREVLQLVAEGRTIRGIAKILDITSRTVVFHKTNLMDKLGLRTTAELTRHAIQCGLVAIPRTVLSHQPTLRRTCALHA